MSTTGIQNDSTLMKVPKQVVNKRVTTARGKTEVIQAFEPLHQAQIHHHSESFYTQCFKGVPQNLFRNNGSKFSGMIQAGAFTKLKSATLKITVENRGLATQLAGLPYWFDRIEMRSANGSKHLGTIYNDNLAFNLGALLTDDQLKSVLPSANLDENFEPLRAIQGNEKKTYYLPLVGGFLDTAHLYWKNIQGDFFIDLFPSKDIRTTYQENSTNAIDCLDICLIVQTEDLDDRDNMTHEKFHSNTISTSRYLDVIPISFYNESLVANQEKKLELDSVSGNVAGFVMYVKKTGATNFNDENNKYVSLGSTATLDLLDSGSQSLWGNGVALPAEYLKNELWVNHFSNDYNQKKNFYFMPFGGSMKSAFHGVVDGYVKMMGERNYISIRPAEVGVKRVFTLTAQALPLQDSVDPLFDANLLPSLSLGADYRPRGWIRLGFGGYTTGRILLNQEPTLTSYITGELLKLPSFKNWHGTRLTCTTTAPTADWTKVGYWTCTITIDQTVEFPNGEAIEIVEQDCFYQSQINAPINQDLSNNVTTWVTRPMDIKVTGGTVWKEGFVSGNYDISLYALVYKQIHSYNGKLTVEME